MGIESIQQVNLAATGQIPTQSQPGQRFGPGLLLPSLTNPPLIDLSSCALIKQTPIPSIFGMLLQSGKFGLPRLGLGEAFARSAMSDFSKANQEGIAWIQQAAATLREARPDEVHGNGLPRDLGRARGAMIEA